MAKAKCKFKPGDLVSTESGEAVVYWCEWISPKHYNNTMRSSKHHHKLGFWFIHFTVISDSQYGDKGCKTADLEWLVSQIRLKRK